MYFDERHLVRWGSESHYSYAFALSPGGDHFRVRGVVAGAVRAEFLEEARVEAVFGAVGERLADHFAGEIEVSEDLSEGKMAPIGGELLVDVLDTCLVRRREAGAAAAGDAVELEEAEFVPEGEVGEVVFGGPAVEVRSGHLLFAEPRDGLADTIARDIHLEEELVAGATEFHADVSSGEREGIATRRGWPHPRFLRETT